MTNEEFGQRVGCHHSMASRLRAGKRLPGLDLMQRISKEFGVPLTELVDARNKGGEAFARLLQRRVFDPADKQRAA